jgi:hypothetical protein
MARSGDLADDDVTRPTLRPIGVELLPIGVQLDGRTHLAHQCDVDARRHAIALHRQSALGSCESSTRASTDVAGERAEPTADRGDPRQGAGFVVDDELDVVDLADEATLAIDELTIEELQDGPDTPARGGGFAAHAPAFVAIINGIVASATMTSKIM